MCGADFHSACAVATIVACAVGVALAVIVVVFAINIVSGSDSASAEKLPALQAGSG